MASRDIASMHLFLEMKNKFPDLSEDTIRNYVFHCANDKDKCTELLHKESKSFHAGQLFADLYLPESNHRENEFKSIKRPANNASIGNSIPHASLSPTIPSHRGYFPHNHLSTEANEQSSSHPRLVWVHDNPMENLRVHKKPESQSAPVMASHDKPFTDMYRSTPVSSHGEFYQNPTNDQDSCHRMMFSTTKEHTILPQSPSGSEITHFPVSPRNSSTKRQTVQLSIVPSSPFQQQQFNVYNSYMPAVTLQSSKPSRHTTSLNFQIQPSSDQYPLEISTIPTNMGLPCDSRDFGSHVQVSVGPQGTTFTSLRLQRPQSQIDTTMQLASPDQVACSKFPDSSQVQKSKAYNLSPRHKHVPMMKGSLAEISEVQGENEPNVLPKGHSSSVLTYDQPQKGFSRVRPLPRNKNAQVGMARGYQQSQAYMQDVINHQDVRLDLLLQELIKEKSNCTALKVEVNKMEQEVSKTRLQKNSFAYAAELQKLREENRKLQIECNCLLIEVDLMNNSGQIPLGETDEDFYSNIFTGPNGAIAPVEKGEPPKEYDSISSKVNQVPVTPSKKVEKEEEQNRWACKKCTFANHPSLQDCEICEFSRSSGYVECNSNCHSNTEFRFVSSPDDTVGTQPRRAVGSIQISVTRRVQSSPKSVKFQLTHRMPR